jgi:outer membrane protein OmpA-like peptidoglycan-associated protein
LLNFFRSSEATVFSIAGHTDARASDAYNLRLSQRRANAVAAIVREAGKQVSQSVGYGERKTRATNNTA